MATQQRLPWAPPARQDVSALPLEIWGGYCLHHRLVGFWQERPSQAEMAACAAVELKRLGAREVQRDIGRMCQWHPETWSTDSVKEDVMGIVKGGELPDPAPEGLARVVCVDNYTKEDVETSFGKKDKEYFVFEHEQLNPNHENKPFLVIVRHTASIGPKSNLTKFLESWRGQKFSKEDRDKGFDCERVVGACAQVMIIHNHKDDGSVFANVESIMPLARGMEKLKPSGQYKRMKDRDAKDRNMAGTVPEPDEDELPF